VWNLLIRTGQVLHALPLLEASLGSFGARPSRRRRGAHTPTLSRDLGRPLSLERW